MLLSPLPQIRRRRWYIYTDRVGFVREEETIVHEPLTPLCVTNAPKSVGGRVCIRGRERERGGGHFTMRPYCRSFRCGGSVQYVDLSFLLCSFYIYIFLFFFFLQWRPSRLTAPHQIFATGSMSWGSLLLRARLTTVRDWGHLESRLSGRRGGGGDDGVALLFSMRKGGHS